MITNGLSAQTKPADWDAQPSAQFVYNPEIAITVPAPGSQVTTARAMPYWVAVGDWKRVAEILSALPAADAAKVYAHIIDDVLQTANTPLPEPPTLTKVQDTNSGKPVISAKPLLKVGVQLQPPDVLDLADALPQKLPLQNATATALGQLLAKTTGAAGMPDAIIQRLRQGTLHMGGTDRDHTSATVNFLVSAGQPDLAMTFLPDEATVFTLNSPGVAMLYQQCLLASADGAHDPDVANQRRHTALRLTLAMLDRSMSDAVSKPLLQLAIELADKTGDHQIITSWIGDLLANRAPELPFILQYLIRPIPPAGGQFNYDLRLSRLMQQGQLVEMISAAHLSDQPYDTALRSVKRSIAMNWATEADFTRQIALVPPRDVVPGDSRTFQRTFGIAPDMIKEIPPEQLLALEPNDAWDGQIEPNDHPRFDIDRLSLLMASNRVDQAMEVLNRMAKQDSSREAEEKVAGTALSVWVYHNMPVRVAIQWYRGAKTTTGIPTAKTTQDRNLDQMVKILDQIRQAYGRPFPQPILAPLFDFVHSQAEVYTLEEIQRIFGPVEQMDYTAILQLYASMQKNLRESWASDQVQAASGTNRTDEQQMQAMLDGYHTLTTVMEKRSAVAPDWRLLVALATARFQEAEFGFKNNSGFAAYTTRRDSAFDAMHRAAVEYAKTVTPGDNGSETIDLYTVWFSMALGASDLASVHVDQVPTKGEIQRLHDALYALPGRAAQRHIDRFANLLQDQAPSLAPDVKERITRNALIMLGDTPLANPLRAIMQSYADLLEELNFDVSLDGSSRVGAKESFGLFVSVQHSNSLEAECHGFSKYVSTQDQSSQAAHGQAAHGQWGRSNYRVNFEKHLHEALDKSFEIRSVVWAPDSVHSRPIDRTGWSKTSLAYVVVEAKDASVDRIPPVQMDVDFNDRMNVVILPVTSSALVVDAASAEPRPVTELAIDQRLNDHDFTKGILKIEVRASGRGLIPTLDKLLNLSSLGRFAIVNIVDHGLKVESFDTNPSDPKFSPSVLSGRDWIVTLQASTPVTGNVQFQFPALRDQYAGRHDVAPAYHRYDDADLVATGSAVVLHGIDKPVFAHAHSIIVMIAILALFALVIGVILLKRSRGRYRLQPEAENTIETAPSLFGKLRILNTLKLDSERTQTDWLRLDQDIRNLETAYFAKPRHSVMDPPSEKQLDQILNQWS